MDNMTQPTDAIFVIPPHFLSIRYNGAHYPGSPNTNGLEGRANCQQFAYELLRHNGFSLPDLRSRLGFHFGGKSQRVLQDPDGRYVEIWG